MDGLTRMSVDFYLTTEQVTRLESLSKQYRELFPDSATPGSIEDMFKFIMLTGSTHLINDQMDAFEILAANMRKCGDES